MWRFVRLHTRNRAAQLISSVIFVNDRDLTERILTLCQKYIYWWGRTRRLSSESSDRTSGRLKCTLRPRRLKNRGKWNRLQSWPSRSSKRTNSSTSTCKTVRVPSYVETGVKVMEQARRSSDCDSDEDTENLGDLCITNLKNLSRGSQHMYRYLDNIKSHKHRKEHIESILGGRKT